MFQHYLPSKLSTLLPSPWPHSLHAGLHVLLPRAPHPGYHLDSTTIQVWAQTSLPGLAEGALSPPSGIQA